MAVSLVHVCDVSRTLSASFVWYLSKRNMSESEFRRGGRPGLPVPNSPYGLCGRKATLNLNSEKRTSVDRIEPTGWVLGHMAVVATTVKEGRPVPKVCHTACRSRSIIRSKQRALTMKRASFFTAADFRMTSLTCMTYH